MLTRSQRKYRVIWRRVGDADLLRHDVLAQNPAQAESRSRADLQLALGANSEAWEFDIVTELADQTLVERLLYRFLRPLLAHTGGVTPASNQHGKTERPGGRNGDKTAVQR